MITLGIIALGVTGLGLITASTFGSITLAGNIKWTMQLRSDHTKALIENKLLDTLNNMLYPPKAKNYRHNIHCPSCGRFAKRVLGKDTVVECKNHGIQIRKTDLPVQWQRKPIGPNIWITYQPIILAATPIEPLPSLELDEVEVEQVYREIVRDYTGPITIIPDTVDELLELASTNRN